MSSNTYTGSNNEPLSPAIIAAAVENPLSPPNVTESLLKCLPRSSASTASAEASVGSEAGSGSSQHPATHVLLRNGAELIMATFHACLVQLGFRFRGLGEEGIVSSEEASPTTQTPSSVLPSDWNRSGDTFSFRYTHDQSTFTFLLKGVKVATKLLVHCLAIQDGKLYTLDLNIGDYISPTAPTPLLTEEQADAPYIETASRPGTWANPAFALYAGITQFETLVYKFRTEIIDRVMPSINKPGYENAPAASSGSSSSTQQPRRDPLRDYDRDRREQPPYFHPGGVGGVGPMYPRGSPYGIGDVDLDPFGAAPGMIPPRGGMHPGGGMVVGPDHPMFGGGPGFPRGPGGFGGGRGGFGGGGIGGIGGAPGGGFYGGGGVFLPPGAVPPGARFDPIGPFGGPAGPGRGGFPPPGRPGRGGPGGGRMDPDNDEFLPPGGGYDDMYM
ncbi:hypothetical protein HDU76_005870 [Blyttiomyces sp. JEL0837]|nr:hypothetical protein HDU76_005870 [Blyttiomyces sp. JEL0837]